MDETTHTRTVELLPWLVNGTLEPGERRSVEEHLGSCLDCRSELEETREAFSLYDAHLPVAALVGYAEAPEARTFGVGDGHLEQATVEGHLEHCDACREVLALTRDSLARLSAQPAKVESASDEPLATVTPFDRFTAIGTDAGTSPAGREATYRKVAPWLPMAMAATLVLAMVSAGGWFYTAQGVDAQEQQIAKLEKRLAEAEAADLEAPDVETADTGAEKEQASVRREMERQLEELRTAKAQADGRLAHNEEEIARLRGGTVTGGVVYVPLSGGDVLRSGAPAAPPEGRVAAIRLDAGTGGVLLQPAVDEIRLTGVDTLRFRLTDANGGSLEEGSLPIVDESQFDLGRYVSLFVPASRLPSGTLTLELFDGTELVGEYRFRVER